MRQSAGNTGENAPPGLSSTAVSRSQCGVSLCPSYDRGQAWSPDGGECRILASRRRDEQRCRLGLCRGISLGPGRTGRNPRNGVTDTPWPASSVVDGIPLQVACGRKIQTSTSWTRPSTRARDRNLPVQFPNDSPARRYHRVLATETGRIRIFDGTVPAPGRSTTGTAPWPSRRWLVSGQHREPSRAPPSRHLLPWRSRRNSLIAMNRQEAWCSELKSAKVPGPQPLAGAT